MRYLLLLFIMFIFSSCGSGGGDTQTQNPSSSSIDITVERGPVYEANITDANGMQARQIGNSNIYRFDTKPTYPIRAIGGWIDVDGDGNKTANDLDLDFNLTSYGTNITPITTLLAQSDKTKRDALKQFLSNQFLIEIDKLEDLPSKSDANNYNVAVLTNAIFKMAKDYNKSIEALSQYENITDTENVKFKNLKVSFDDIKDLITSSDILEDGILHLHRLESKTLHELNITYYEDEDYNGVRNDTTPNTDEENCIPVLKIVSKISQAIEVNSFTSLEDRKNQFLNNEITVINDSYIKKEIRIYPTLPLGFELTRIRITKSKNNNLHIAQSSASIINLEKYDVNSHGPYMNGTFQLEDGVAIIEIIYPIEMTENFTLNIEVQSDFNVPLGISLGLPIPVKTSIINEEEIALNIKEVNLNSDISFNFSSVEDSNGFTLENGFILPTNTQK